MSDIITGIRANIKDFIAALQSGDKEKAAGLLKEAIAGHTQLRYDKIYAGLVNEADGDGKFRMGGTTKLDGSVGPAVDKGGSRPGLGRAAGEQIRPKEAKQRSKPPYKPALDVGRKGAWSEVNTNHALEWVEKIYNREFNFDLMDYRVFVISKLPMEKAGDVRRSLAYAIYDRRTGKPAVSVSRKTGKPLPTQYLRELETYIKSGGAAPTVTEGRRV